MKINVKRIHSDAQIPTYAHDGDSGLDLYAVEECYLYHGERKLVKTGIAIELPYSTEAQVRPRSGLALKQGLTVLNTPGTVDSCYRNEIGVILIYHGEDRIHITKGMKIAQLVICPVYYAELQEVEELSDTQRGLAGFGSTGV